MEPKFITCRSKVSEACKHDASIRDFYTDVREYRDDGTYDSRDSSIVCDSCYVALGCPSISITESPEKIREFRTNIGRDHEVDRYGNSLNMWD